MLQEIKTSFVETPSDSRVRISLRQSASYGIQAVASVATKVLSFHVQEAYWETLHCRYRQALSPFHFHPPPLTEKSIELFTEGLLRRLVERKKLNIEQGCAVALKKDLDRKGYCHGESLSLYLQVVRHPDLPEEQMVEQLQERAEEIVRYQVEECLDGEGLRAAQFDPFYKPIFFEYTQALYEELTNFISTSIQGPCLVRVWNDHSKEAHTVFLMASLTESSYLFYNRSFGLYRYEDRKALTEGFLSHLYYALPYLFQSGGAMAIYGAGVL